MEANVLADPQASLVDVQRRAQEAETKKKVRKCLVSVAPDAGKSVMLSDIILYIIIIMFYLLIS